MEQMQEIIKERAMQYAEEAFAIRRLRAEYKKQALLGDRMYPVIYAGDSVTVVSLNNEEGQAYCVVEFRQDMENGSEVQPLHAETAERGKL